MIKTLAVVIFMIFGIGAGAFGQKTAAIKAEPAKNVRKAFDRLIDGIKQVDVEKVMDAYENSSETLIFNNNGTVTKGWDNIKTNVSSSYPKITNVTIDITGLRIEMLGKTGAYVTCKWSQAQENEGKLENASGRMTLIYKLKGEDWKIVHRHTSPDNPGANRPVMSSERVPPAVGN